jgi:hypothetical protein
MNLRYIDTIVERSPNLAKGEHDNIDEETGAEWSQRSLTFAMRGMEDEEGPEYTDDDLRESF